MDSDSSYIFVYGTLRDKSVNHQAHYLQANAKLVASGTILGKLFKITWYPAAVVEESGDKVYGDIYQLPVTSKEVILHELDGYEGIYSSNEESDEYERILTIATTDSGEELTCWVYNYKANIDDAEHITSGDFLDYLKSRQ